MTQELWLRCETKKFERRAALTPTTASQLLAAGFSIKVERDAQRVFDDDEYEKVGCTLVDNSTWASAPLTTPVIGLKELPETSEPLDHTHIHFAHCYKGQEGWADVLMRFGQGGGILYDLEFLNDEHGRRVAAFGFHAGFAGAGAAVLAFAAKQSQALEGFDLKPYNNEHEMISQVKQALGGHKIKALVMGALGRCGRGAVDLLQKVGLEDSDIIKWDMAETAKGGPFPEILEADIFVNCIYLSSQIPPFLTNETVAAAGPNRRLSVIADVSCDTTNPHNPIPVYDKLTYFDAPTLEASVGEGNPSLSVIAIDHLPTLLPREASEQFSKDLLPSLIQLPQRQEARVWVEAEALFEKKLAEARAHKA